MEILFEDNHLFVVNKPAGIPTQDVPGMANSLEAQAKNWIKERYQKPGAVYLHAIHRLDKPVSGVVVFARTSKALSRLNEEIRAKKTKKNYLAIVEGAVTPSQGRLEHYLFHGEHKAVLSNAKHGQEARLTYLVLQKASQKSHVYIALDTGRYHQIRAQFSFSGHPIYGDQKYGSSSRFKENAIALHHYRFIIAHPTTKEEMVFKAPCSFMTDDLLTFLPQEEY
ncbi:Pseudouridine synthase [Chlamydiales bacterium STE3]|nr:Pseudouridine synthase [Chlamydiales bacterium STE3]